MIRKDSALYLAMKKSSVTAIRDLVDQSECFGGTTSRTNRLEGDVIL